ncbi:hypothetical protein BpHYR1_054016 [Brachionus plicatilis]|uniref:Uncharacterized protein n=1 Tax=Brachionus plicatilis TaxID=10195 RepID=A0A3M7PVH2_BRAPC|nr:hypothetical protein BpHYR1_054016 [Brachionus plicatilis]
MSLNRSIRRIIPPSPLNVSHLPQRPFRPKSPSITNFFLELFEQNFTMLTNTKNAHSLNKVDSESLMAELQESKF